MEPKKPSDSDVEATFIIQPPDTNVHGTAFGGRIMQWMDITAGVAANRHCRKPCVTVSVDQLHFAKPIQLGDIVIIKARVNYVGKTSMEVGVRVCKESPSSGLREHCLTGYFTFVAIGTTFGKPVDVPMIIPTTDEDKRRYQEAEKRREIRLANK